MKNIQKKLNIDLYHLFGNTNILGDDYVFKIFEKEEIP